MKKNILSVSRLRFLLLLLLLPDESTLVGVGLAGEPGHEDIDLGAVLLPLGIALVFVLKKRHA